MKAFHVRTAILLAGLTLAAGPALAQKAGPGGGGNGGNGGGGANAGGGGATTSGSSVVGSSGGSSSTTTSTSSSGFSSPSAGGYGSSSASYRGAGAMRTAAPEHRTSFSYSDSQHATPRASSGRTPNTPATATNATSSQARAGGARAVARSSGSTEAANNSAVNREVPSWSRNRGGRPATGSAIPRSPDNPAPGTAAYYQSYLNRYGYYNPYYYDPFGIYGFYGFGGGYYGFYDPFYSPYGFGGYGLDPGFGYGYFGDPTDPYMYGEGYGSYSSRVYSGQGEGALKLKVKPRNAKVYVDGYFVGLVDQFDGMMQKLTLNGGSHKVEVKADGYETAEFDVLITPGQTLTFAGDLKKLQ